MHREALPATSKTLVREKRARNHHRPVDPEPSPMDGVYALPPALVRTVARPGRSIQSAPGPMPTGTPTVSPASSIKRGRNTCCRLVAQENAACSIDAQSAECASLTTDSQQSGSRVLDLRKRYNACRLWATFSPWPNLWYGAVSRQPYSRLRLGQAGSIHH